MGHTQNSLGGSSTFAAQMGAHIILQRFDLEIDLFFCCYFFFSYSVSFSCFVHLVLMKVVEEIVVYEV